MAKIKLSAKRPYITFTYTFSDGTEAEFQYYAPTTKIIEKGLELDSNGATYSEMVKFTKDVLRDLIKGNDEAKNKMLTELEEFGDIYEFKNTLDEQLGKLKAKR